MAMEKPVTVLHEVDHDEDIEQQDDEDWHGKVVHQLVSFDWDEKDRFANGHPAGPGDAVDQADSFHQGEHAIKGCATSQPEEVFRRYLFQAAGKFREKLSFGV